MEDFAVSVKELSQKWSKSQTLEEKKLLGGKCITASIGLCTSMETYKDINAVEQKCRVLSYPLANSIKMDDSQSFVLLEAFSLVLTMHNSSNKPISSLESVAKCCAHFMQAIAQYAMKICKSDLMNTKILYRIANTIKCALTSDAVAGVHSSLTVEQFNQLVNYTIDAALALCARIDLAEPHSSSSSSSSSSISSIQSSSSKVGSANALRMLTLTTVQSNICTYRASRCLDQLTKHFNQLCKGSRADHAAQLINVVETWINHWAAATPADTISDKLKKELDAKDMIKIVLWRCESAGFSSSIVSSLQNGRRACLHGVLEGCPLAPIKAAMRCILQLEKCLAMHEMQPSVSLSEAVIALSTLESIAEEVCSDSSYLEMAARLVLSLVTVNIRCAKHGSTDGDKHLFAAIMAVVRLFNAVYVNINSDEKHNSCCETKGSNVPHRGSVERSMLMKVLAKMQVDCLNSMSVLLKESPPSSMLAVAVETLAAIFRSLSLASFLPDSLSVLTMVLRAAGNCLSLVPPSYLLQNYCGSNHAAITSSCGMLHCAPCAAADLTEELFSSMTQCGKTLTLMLETLPKDEAAMDISLTFQSLAIVLTSRLSGSLASASSSARLLAAALSISQSSEPMQASQGQHDQRNRLMQLLVGCCVRASMVPVDLERENACHQVTMSFQEFSQENGRQGNRLLFGLVTELSARAGELVAVGAATLDAALGILITCSQHCTKAIRETLQLYVLSYVHWARGAGPSDPDCEALIDSIKTLVSALDPSLNAGIATVSTKKREKPKKTDAPAATPATPSLQNSALVLRLTLLLVSWSSPLTASKLDSRASDGAQGAAVYLSGALKALRAAAAAVHMTGSTTGKSFQAQDDALMALCCLEADAQALFFLLGLHGRTADQAKIAPLLLQINNSIAASTEKDPPAANLFRLAGDLTLFTALLGVYSNQATLERDRRWSPDLSSVRPYLQDASAPEWYTKISQLLTVSSALLADSGETHRSSSAAQVTLQRAACDIDSLAECALTAASSKANSSSNPLFLQAVRSWMCLLVSKAKMYTMGLADHKDAFVWARRALCTATTTSSAKSSVETTLARLEAVLLTVDLYEISGNIDSALSYLSEALAMAKLGSRALYSLVNFHSLRIWHRTGSLRLISCLQDMLTVDEFSIQDVHDDVTKQCRVVAECLAPILGDEADEAEGSINTLELQLSESSISSRAQAIEGKLQFRHVYRAWDTVALSAAPHSTQGAPDSPAHAKEFLTGNSSRNGYNTLLSGNVRTCIDSFRDPAVGELGRRFLSSTVISNCGTSAHPNPHGILNNCATKLSIDSSIDALVVHGNLRTQLDDLLKVSEGIQFDVIRDLRRHCCLQLMAACSASSSMQDNCHDRAGLLVFLLGAAGCGVALECSVDGNLVRTSQRPGAQTNNIVTNGNTAPPLSPVASELCSISDLLRSACAAQPRALEETRRNLKSIIGRLSATPTVGTNSVAPSPPGALVFATLESVTGNLLLGRMGAMGTPLVVSLPIAAQIRELLKRWEGIMETSKAALQKTMNVEAVKKWGEKEKKAWWGGRQESDKAIQQLLDDLQSLIGPWRCLLSAPTHSVNLPQQLSSSSSSSTASCMSGVPAHLADWAVALSAGIASPAALDRAEAIAALHSLTGDMEAATQYIDACIALQEQALPAAVHGSGDATVLSPTTTLSDSALDVLTAELSNLKVTELRKRLKECGMSGDGLKKDLVSRLIEALGVSKSGVVTRAADNATKSSGFTGNHSVPPLPASNADHTSIPAQSKAPETAGHTVLLLDEALQALPWECMPALRGQQCSRVPGLALLMAMGKTLDHSVHSSDTGDKGDANDLRTKTRSQALQLKKTWFAVDPEGNLPDTRKTMDAFLAPYASKWGWKGVVGSLPDEMMTRSNHENSDLFIYCGHGAGERMCDSRAMRRYHAPAALLWGCSSGRLGVLGVHDPSGMALSYMIAGAPFVLANLWDVTDKDIDRLSMSCMDTVLQSEDKDGLLVLAEKENCSSSNSHGNQEATRGSSGASISRALGQARLVCKLNFAVGSAPVMYGLPCPLNHAL